MRAQALILGAVSALALSGVARAQDTTIQAIAQPPAGAPAAPPVRLSPRQELESLRASAVQMQAELAAARGQLAQAQTALHALQKQDEAIKATLASTGATLEACKAKNVALLNVGYEILGRYKREGLHDVIAGKEPFTGLKRVQLQNLAQGYEDRVYAGRYDPRRDKAPPPPPAAADVTKPSSH